MRIINVGIQSWRWTAFLAVAEFSVPIHTAQFAGKYVQICQKIYGAVGED
ncbi:hypothetical protein Z949_291 [Sulfitobacter guttiformis KCTC 32187]|nr:hypothetical protein Z949_291 [Sulfitobacter guttiformis KCTC 32187]